MNEVTPKIKQYLDILAKYEVSGYADEYLDKLDELWYSMTDEEIDYIESYDQ